MRRKIMNIAVAQSGGPTAAINASLAGVFKQALNCPQIEKIYGSRNGIEGVISDNLVYMNEVLSIQKNLEILRVTPSTALGSCRYKLPEVNSGNDVYEKITACFKKHDIGAFFYIGGNDSMDTAAKLSDYFKTNNIDIKVIGVPKTIDNDLPGTDHTPGFGSAAKYVAATLSEIICDSSVYALESVTIVEIMGRNAGWLTASSCVLRAAGETAPHLIYLPESKFTAQQFIDDIRQQQKTHKAVIIAVSEGVELGDENCLRNDSLDVFGHKQLSGIGKTLEQLVRREIGCKVRSIELNVMQRCSAHICSKTDITEAESIGAEAVNAAVAGNSGVMMTFVRKSSSPYEVEISFTDAHNIANQVQFFPEKWINSAGNNVSDEAIEYFLPLIQGEIFVPMEKGLPVHFKF